MEHSAKCRRSVGKIVGHQMKIQDNKTFCQKSPNLDRARNSHENGLMKNEGKNLWGNCERIFLIKNCIENSAEEMRDLFCQLTKKVYAKDQS